MFVQPSLFLAPAAEKVDSIIYWINKYPVPYILKLISRIWAASILGGFIFAILTGKYKNSALNFTIWAFSTLF